MELGRRTTASFQPHKKRLISPPTLTHYDPNAKIGYFVGTLQNARAWDKPMAWIRVNGTALHFRIDSGADVTVISHDDLKPSEYLLVKK